MSRRRLRIACVLLLLGGAAAVLLLRVPAWSHGLLEARLSTVFQRRVEIGGLEYSLLPRPRVELREVRVAGPRPLSPPFLEAREVVLAPRLRPLWERRTLLGRVRVVGLKVRLNAFADGSHDLPAFRTGGLGGREVRADRVLVEEGELIVNHQRVPLDLNWRDVSARLFATRGGGLAGRLGIGHGELRFSDAPPLPVSLDTELELSGSRLEVRGARLKGPGTDLLADGALDWGEGPRARFQVRGAVDLGVIDRHVTRTGLGLEGRGRAEGLLTLGPKGVRFEGAVRGQDGSFEQVAVPRYSGHVAWDGQGLRIRDLDLETLGGLATLQVEVPARPGAASLEAQFARVDAEALAALLFDVGRPGLGASVTGEASVSWPRGRIGRLSGTARVELEAASDGRTPLWGALSWSARDGEHRLEGTAFHTPGTHARLAGSIGRDLEADLAVDGEAADLAEADALFVRLRRALGASEPQGAELSGGGRFEGRWLGTLAAPVFEGRFHGQDLGYLGVVWGRAEWAGTLTGRELRSHSLVLRRDGGELWVDGDLATGDYGSDDGLDVRLRLVRWPAEDLLAALEWDLDLKGRLSGEAQVRGRRSAPSGTAELTAAEGTYYGVPFSELALTADVDGRRTGLPVVQARVGGGEVRFRGTAYEGGIYDLEAEWEGVEAGALLPRGAGVPPWGGALSGKALLQGTLAHPRLEARVSSPALMLGEESLGALEAVVRGSGDGQVAVEARTRSESTDLLLAGDVGAVHPYVADLRLAAARADLLPVLRLADRDLPAGLQARTSGHARLRGPLAAPLTLSGEVELTELALEWPDYPVRNLVPLRASLRGGRFDVGELRLAAEGTDLRVSGQVPLSPEGALQLAVAGTADLRVVSLLVPELRGRGSARLEVQLTGSPGAPRLDGTLAVEGATLRARGFPHGIEDVRGEARFTEGAAQFSGVRATVGGGPVEMSGEASYAGGRLRSFDLRASGRRLALRYPEGLRSVVDAELRLVGDGRHQWLTGRVDVRQAVWSRRYDVASELLAESGLERSDAGGTEGVRLDVRVVAPGTLRVDNNLAQLVARADLRVQGLGAAPVVLGRAEVERGRVFFQGNTYFIRRGAVEFASPHRIEPLFDIEAEARVRSYRVTLRVNGTLDRLYPTLSADPHLSTVQILTLLAGADEATVDSFGAVAARDLAQRQLAAAGAATLAAGRLSEEMGLERGAAKLGLDRFSIDPSVVRGDVSDPTARVTLGKRVTPDVNILYSLDLRGTEERLVSVEYTLSDRLSVLMTRVEPGGFGFDLRVRQSR